MDGSAHGWTPQGGVPHPRHGEMPPIPAQAGPGVWAAPPAAGPYVQAPQYLLQAGVQDYDFYAPPPRSEGKRAAIFAGFAAAYVGAWILIATVVLAVPMWSVDPSLYSSDVAYNAAMDRAAEPWYPLFVVLGLTVQLVAFALLARRVHYRWFDTFLSLIPVYGYVFMIKILWRCTDIRQFRQPPDPYARARRHNPYYSQASSY
jgi:hypothetical protein